MEKLMKPAEYAKELGISRQAVYAKIKRGILTAKDVEGKLYIVVDSDSEQKTSTPQVSTSPKSQSNASKQHATVKTLQEYKQLLDAKNETIAVLKGTVEDLKESNRQMSSTLKGEIDLLKAAFSEMKSLYTHRIEQMKSDHSAKREEVLDAKVKEPKQAKVLEEWVSSKRFFKDNDIRTDEEKKRVQKKLKKAYKRGDQRLSKENGKLKIDISQSYNDLLQ